MGEVKNAVNKGGVSGLGLESTLLINNESTTQDAIFRLNADKYLKINRASQTIELWDEASSSLSPITVISIDGFTISEAVYGGASINIGGVDYLLPTGTASQIATLLDIPAPITSEIVTANKTAENDTPYTANGTITFTDPTPVTNKGYIVHVIGGTSTIGGVGYTTGALVYRYYDGSVWISKNYGLNTSSNYADDSAAATGGIPIGGLYHTSGVVKIRLT